MIDQYELLADHSNLVAVVGATDSPGKYGGVIYRDLKGRGHRVVAVNPHRDTVDGDPAYPDLASLPERPVLIDVVVPPWQGRNVVAEAADLGYSSIWFQPGAYTAGVVEQAEAAGLDVVAGPCIMVVSRNKASRT